MTPFSLLKIISPDFESVPDEWKAKAFIVTPFKSFRNLILVSLNPR